MDEDIKDELEKKFKNVSFTVKKVKSTNNGHIFRILFEDYSIGFIYIKSFTFNYNISYLIDQIEKIRNGQYKVRKEGIENDT
jgi:hypothetical protein